MEYTPLTRKIPVGTCCGTAVTGVQSILVRVVGRIHERYLPSRDSGVGSYYIEAFIVNEITISIAHGSILDYNVIDYLYILFVIFLDIRLEVVFVILLQIAFKRVGKLCIALYRIPNYLEQPLLAGYLSICGDIVKGEPITRELGTHGHFILPIAIGLAFYKTIAHERIEPIVVRHSPCTGKVALIERTATEVILRCLPDSCKRVPIVKGKVRIITPVFCRSYGIYGIRVVTCTHCCLFLSYNVNNLAIYR